MTERLVAVLGGGQLGRMLALAGTPLGLRFRFLDPSPEAPARRVGELVVGAFDDKAALDRLAHGAEVVTYEFENVPVDAARALEATLPVLPSPQALDVAQDRLSEKELFVRLGVPTTRFEPVDDERTLRDALARIGVPAVLKARRLGYDGKGQAVIRSPGEAAAAWAAVRGAASILENLAPFDRELSVLAARSRDGRLAVYPLVENVHRDGILRVSRAPAPDVDDRTRGSAEGHARRVMESLGYVGLLAIEFFECAGELVANEMAPRVHNSGHWTIEGAQTSQFESHLRAVVGLPLGSAAARGRSVMLNIIGRAPPPEAVLSVEGAHLHLYGKAAAPGRKTGHITLVGDDQATLDARVAMLRRSLHDAGWVDGNEGAVG